jgi:hypothetical protein
VPASAERAKSAMGSVRSSFSQMSPLCTGVSCSAGRREALPAHRVPPTIVLPTLPAAPHRKRAWKGLAQGRLQQQTDAPPARLRHSEPRRRAGRKLVCAVQRQSTPVVVPLILTEEDGVRDEVDVSAAHGLAQRRQDERQERTRQREAARDVNSCASALVPLRRTQRCQPPAAGAARRDRAPWHRCRATGTGSQRSKSPRI